MNRDYIAEHDIVGRYVAGTLSTKESEAFELAFFQDEELAAQVLVEQRLRQALAPNAANRQPATSRNTEVPARRGLLARAVALLAVVVPATWLVSQWSDNGARSPRALTQVLSLHATRGAPRGAATNAGPSLPMPESRDAIIALHIDIAQVPLAAERALLAPDGLSPQPLVTFDRDGIEQSNGLIIELPAALITPGAYVLELQDGQARTVQRLPFRITLPSDL